MTATPFFGQHFGLPPRARWELGAGLVHLVGESPRPGAEDGEEPLSDGRSAWKLAQLAGLSREAYLKFFDRANVLCRHADGLSLEQRLAAAQTRAYVLREGLEQLARSYPAHGVHVVVLGRLAWRALGFGEQPFFACCGLSDRQPGVHYRLFPHPSRRSRLWNLPETEERGLQALQDLVRLRLEQGYPVEGRTLRHT